MEIDFLERRGDSERMSMDRSLLAAQGYVELEMTDEALRELDEIGANAQDREEVLQVRLFVLMRGRRWLDASTVCDRLRDIYPRETTGFIHGAFCLHELGRTREATYYYNLSCYDAVLGNIEDAQHALEISFKMDDKFREIAKYDPDLRELSGLL